MDGPKIAADTTNNRVWVWWYNGNGSTSTGRHFLRPVGVGATGSMSLGTTIELTGKFPVNPLHATIAVRPATSAGQLPTIYLAFPSAGMTLNQAGCAVPAGQTTLDVTWYLEVSTDGGQTWEEYTIDRDPKWKRCLTAAAKHGNRSYVATTFDPVSGRLVLAYNKSVYDSAGDYVGTRVITKQWPSANGGVGFDSWTPICNPAVCPDKKTNCLVNGAPPKGETFCNMWGQMVGRRAVGSSSRAAVVYYDTHDSEPFVSHPAVGDETTYKELRVDVWGHSIRPGTPFDGPPNNAAPATRSRLTPLGSTIPWKELATNGNTWWGDYQQAVIDGGSYFYAIWGDNRDGTNLAKLWGVKFNE